jgi:hypothetical protein
MMDKPIVNILFDAFESFLDFISKITLNDIIRMVQGLGFLLLVGYILGNIFVFLRRKLAKKE